MRASRLLAILILLQLRRRVTAAALAAEFEVSQRTIYRDVDALSAAGIPVYGDTGPGGGFQLLDGYRTRLTGIGPDEAEAIPVIGLPAAAAALGIGPAAARARDKLLASLPAASLALAGRMGERFHVDMVDWYRAEAGLPLLPELARAVLESRPASIRYTSWRGTGERRIEPLGLVLKGGAWYCVARLKGRPTIFRVAAIRSLEIEEAAFERPTDFDLAREWRQSLDRFEAELRPRKARLRASATGRRWLAELGAFAEHAVAAAGPPDADGWAEIDLPVEGDAYAARMLIGFGEELEVLEPAGLRTEIGRLATEVRRRYLD